MTLDDYDEVLDLWTSTEGVNLGDDDSRDHMRIYLDRNSGLCFVAAQEGKIVGTALCGYDGRRGILRHLAVEPAHRERGIGRALVLKSLAALAEKSIKKCNVLILRTNAAGLRFWEHMGWHSLEDNYVTLQHQTGPDT